MRSQKQQHPKTPNNKKGPEEPAQWQKQNPCHQYLCPASDKGAGTTLLVSSWPKEVMEVAIVEIQKLLTIYRDFYTNSMPRDYTPARMGKVE